MVEDKIEYDHRIEMIERFHTHSCKNAGNCNSKITYNSYVKMTKLLNSIVSSCPLSVCNVLLSAKSFETVYFFIMIWINQIVLPSVMIHDFDASEFVLTYA